MRLGVTFPTTEIGSDPSAVRDFAQAAEALGYTHLVAYDHVVGASRDRPEGWHGPYALEHAFHEPLTLFAYLAGVTSEIELVTGVLVLPQRQTALVAKQAAEVDLLSGGRLRLGVGIGWNAVEYESLGEPFNARGARLEEQVTLLRRLWSEARVEFRGSWHAVDRAGINPRPSRAIPIWFGGSARAVLQRAARLADGWFPPGGPSGEAARVRELQALLIEQGRDPTKFVIQAGARYRDGTADRWRQHAERWLDLGATQIAISTMNAGLSGPSEHIDAIKQYYEAVAR